MTPAQIRKMDLVHQVREDYKITKNFRMTARNFCLNWRTAKNYVISDEPFEVAGQMKFSYLDPYKEQIMALYENGDSIMTIHRKLTRQGITCKYRSLNYFIHKNLKATRNSATLARSERIVITRRQIFNHVFKYKAEPHIENNQIQLSGLYPLIGVLKEFYKTIRKIFLTQDCASLKKILARTMKTPVL